MALEKIQEVDLIEIKGEYSIQVRQATKVLDDGKQIGGVSYHRHVVNPDSSLDNEDAKMLIVLCVSNHWLINRYLVSLNRYSNIKKKAP